MSDDHVEVASITITRRYYPHEEDPDLQELIHVEDDNVSTVIEGLGMLELAKMFYLNPEEEDEY